MVDICGVIVIQAANIQVADINDHSRTDFPFDVQVGLIHPLILPVVIRAADQRAVGNDQIAGRVILRVR